MKILGKKTLKNNRGIALIITLLIISLLVPMSLQFITSTFFYNISAINHSDGIKGGCAARSGFDYALAVLYEDLVSTQFDSLLESWADSEALTSAAASLFEDVKLEIRIIDHSGKININRLVLKSDTDDEDKFDDYQKPVLTRLLKSLDLGLEDEEVDDIVNSIKDWIDKDDEVTEELGFGAESTYYLGLDQPYSCRNAPMETLEELRLVKGISREIFSELSKYVTVYGNDDGTININTADEQVLKSLHEDMTSELAAEMIDYRNEEKNDLSNVYWYSDVPGMSGKELKSVSVLSTHFEIISTGSSRDMGKRVRAVVERKDQKLSVLSWKVD